MIKVKHARTADCVVAGFRWHKTGKDELVGSLLLGLYDDRGRLHHVGVTSSFTMARRKQLARELAPLREHALDEHPWREWAEAGERRDDAHARRPEPLERRQGSVVGAAADRARVRGEVRPHAGRRGSATRRSFSAGAPTSSRATAATISSRSRRLTSSTKVFGAAAPAAADADLQSSGGSSSGSSASWGGRSSAGTCSRLTRMRVQVLEAAAHRVDQHVGRLEVRGRVGVARLPALEARQRVRLSAARAPISISGCCRASRRRRRWTAATRARGSPRLLA